MYFQSLNQHYILWKVTKMHAFSLVVLSALICRAKDWNSYIVATVHTEEKTIRLADVFAIDIVLVTKKNREVVSLWWNITEKIVFFWMEICFQWELALLMVDKDQNHRLKSWGRCLLHKRLNYIVHFSFFFFFSSTT